MVTDAALGAIVDAARARPAVIAVYLFGSRSRHEETDASDIDFAVLGARPFPFDSLVDLHVSLSEVSQCPVDLVDLRVVDAYLALDAIRGERVYCRDSVLADEFELFVMRRAGDLEPFERERRRLLATTPLQFSTPRG